MTADWDHASGMPGICHSGRTPAGSTGRNPTVVTNAAGFAHADQRASADRAYLTAWAVGFYLTFDRRAIGTKEFEAYLTAVNAGGDPVAAFRDWVGQDVPVFEKDLCSYLARLRPDGTAPAKK